MGDGWVVGGAVFYAKVQLASNQLLRFGKKVTRGRRLPSTNSIIGQFVNIRPTIKTPRKSNVSNRLSFDHNDLLPVWTLSFLSSGDDHHI